MSREVGGVAVASAVVPSDMALVVAMVQTRCRLGSKRDRPGVVQRDGSAWPARAHPPLLPCFSPSVRDSPKALAAVVIDSAQKHEGMDHYTVDARLGELSVCGERSAPSGGAVRCGERDGSGRSVSRRAIVVISLPLFSLEGGR